MQIALRDITYNFHSRSNPAQITVKPGEEFLAQTQLCTGGWLKDENELWSPEKTCALNPAVVVAVEGASMGRMIAAEIIDITPEKVGYTGFNAMTNPLSAKIDNIDYGLNVKTVRIENGLIHWNDRLKLPARPMIGTLGTAPAQETLSNAKGGPHGGNMDVQEICAGSTVYLPVEVDGALLHIGDVHAIQGDGEINCSGGIECQSVVKMRVRVLDRPHDFKCVRIENADYIMTVACQRTAEDSFYLASNQLISWMADGYGFSKREAYLLLGQVMEARSTQFVNPTSSYICKIAKKYLI